MTKAWNVQQLLVWQDKNIILWKIVSFSLGVSKAILYQPPLGRNKFQTMPILTNKKHLKNESIHIIHVKYMLYTYHNHCVSKIFYTNWLEPSSFQKRKKNQGWVTGVWKILGNSNYIGDKVAILCAGNRCQASNGSLMCAYDRPNQIIENQSMEKLVKNFLVLGSCGLWFE